MITAGQTITSTHTDGRTLLLIDLENVVGHGRMTAEDATTAWADVTAQIPVAASNTAVVATGRSSAAHAAFAVRPHRLRVGRGVDGADLQLLQVLATEPVADRYDTVVLVSGDGIFTDAIARLADDGVRVVVVAQEDRLSTRLRLAAHDVVLLDDTRMDVAA